MIYNEVGILNVKIIVTTNNYINNIININLYLRNISVYVQL